MNAILLSAGFGTRFRPYTNTWAKPCIPFLNLPFIGYSLYYAQKFGCRSVVVNTHHLPETIKNTCSSLKQFLNLNINFVHEAPKILDSGGGIKNAKEQLIDSDHFLVFNTDSAHVLQNLDFKKLLNEHSNSKALCTFITCSLKHVKDKARGIWTDNKNNQVLHIGEQSRSDHKFNHYTGVMLLSKKVFEYFNQEIESNILYDVVLPSIINNNETVLVHNIEDLQWFETGNCKGYLDASFSYLDHLIDSPNSDFSKELTDILNFYNLNPILSHTNENRILTLNKSHLQFADQLNGHVILDDKTSLSSEFQVKNSILYNQLSISQDHENTLKFF